MRITKSIKIIIERIVVCEDVRNAFSADKDKTMYNLYMGKVDGLLEALRILKLTKKQIEKLVDDERKRRRNGGEISDY